MGQVDQMEWFEAVDGYCERVDAAFWSEPINAMTNAAFLIAAIWAWRRPELPVMGRVLTVILALIGIGSFLFHTFAQTWAGLADVLPILMFILVYIYVATRDYFNASRGVSWLAVIGFFPLAAGIGWFEESEGLSIVGFNKGGTVTLGDVAVTMVNAVHSSTTRTENGLQAMGSECGFMIEAEGRTIYVSGDTDVMADMAIFNDLHQPEIGILACGGHFTMDMRRAAYAANKFFNFTTIIPCHYRTFPILEQSAQVLIDEVPSARVIEPEVMVPFTL